MTSAPATGRGRAGPRVARVAAAALLLALTCRPLAAAEPVLRWVRLGGPPGGLGYDIRHDFGDPDRWFVTDAFAGVHRSVDDGRTWQPANIGIPAQAGATGDAIPAFSLTVDPHDPRILWAGSQNTGHIYRSTDSGASWVERDDGVTIKYDQLTFRGFTVDPRTSDIVYAMAETTSEKGGVGQAIWGAGTGGMVYRTTDAGKHWDAIWDGGMPSSLARYLWVDPENPDRLFVSTGLFDRGAVGEGDMATNPLGGLGILRSTDRGATWTVLGEAQGLRSLYIGSLFMDPENPDRLLAAAGHVTTGILAYMEGFVARGEVSPFGIYLTEDGGDHWRQVVSPPLNRPTEVFTGVEFCPTEPARAYGVSDYGVYRSDDAGRTWSQASPEGSPWGPAGVVPGWTIDIQCDPRDPDRLFINNYAGGNVLSEDAGRTWVNSSQGYTGAQVLAVTVEPGDPARVYAAGRSGIWRGDDGGARWTGITFPAPDPERPSEPFMPSHKWSSVAVDPARAGHLVAADMASLTLLESFDAGATWRIAWRGSDAAPATPSTPATADRELVVGSIAWSTADPAVAYAATVDGFCQLAHEECQGSGSRVLVSSDAGSSWGDTAGTIPGAPGVIDLGLAPDSPDRVFAATEAGLFRSDDRGSSWQGVPGLPSGVRVRAVAVNPRDAMAVLAGIDRLGVYRSSDGGATWTGSATGLEPNGSLHDLAFDPADPAIVYASDHSSGVYRSTDGGMTWVRINDGLRMRTATGLAIARDGRHVYVGTDGEGVFRLDLDGSPPVALASQAPGPTEAPGTVVTSPGAPGTADPTASAPGPGSSAASGGAPGTTAGPDGVLVVGVVLVSLGALTALLALADGRSRGRSARATRIGAAAALGLLAVGGAIALVALVAPPAAPPVEGTPPPASGPVAVAAELMSEASTIQPGACTVLHWSVQGGFGVELQGAPVAPSGEQQVCPTESTTYVLAVDAGDHLEERSVLVEVVP